MEKRNAVPVRSVQKALEILDMLIFEDPACDGVSLSEIARRMAMPANSAHNLLKSMVVCNYVNQNERGHYIAGTMVEQIGSLNRLRSPRMMDVVVSCCRSTGEALGESVVFATLAGGRRIRVAAFDALRSVRVDHASHEVEHMYRSPTGRVLVALADDEQLKAVLARHGWPGAKWADISSRSQLEQARKEIRRRGSETIENTRTEITAMACPVVDSKGALIGAMGCFAPSYRCEQEQQKKIIKTLQTVAEDISDKL